MCWESWSAVRKETDHATHAATRRTGVAPHRWSGPVVTLSIAHVYWHDSESVILDLRGTLDHRTAADLQAAITAEAGSLPRPRCIVVDFTGVVHVDQAGVGCLAAANRACAVAGVALAVCGTSPLIRALLQLQTGPGPTPATMSGRTAQWCTPVRPARRRRPSRRLPDLTPRPPSPSPRTRPSRGR
ncbi:STAS domain-containing protein [Phytohabitans maris]|uniref:STAS domain-containing protein n=1 Tax=Phytohabitans maris TaxID=3071409 RepID=UPI003D176425